jgi:hypothetical protein
MLEPPPSNEPDASDVLSGVMLDTYCFYI